MHPAADAADSAARLAGAVGLKSRSAAALAGAAGPAALSLAAEVALIVSVAEVVSGPAVEALAAAVAEAVSGPAVEAHAAVAAAAFGLAAEARAAAVAAAFGLAAVPALQACSIVVPCLHAPVGHLPGRSILKTEIVLLPQRFEMISTCCLLYSTVVSPPHLAGGAGRISSCSVTAGRR